MTERATIYLDLTAIGHLRRRSSSLDWNLKVTTILNAKGAFAKVSDSGFSQMRSKILSLDVDTDLYPDTLQSVISCKFLSNR